MNITRASFITKARTWVLLAGLTALFIGIGWAIGGAVLWFFVALLGLHELGRVLLSDKFAIKAARAQAVSRGRRRPSCTTSSPSWRSCTTCRSRGST